ncbi:SipW-dependent-type signal peptide-containing protein [Sediminivirga luteola]|uniref:SipW-dependent-type signal peptide-containing protein n=1 Tax=Sediminivirga luteola TaxID=1774748 RepID=UPI001F562CC8|nr:SipW-dependent-type signal peptide-containing protein [Sediminivirga luteola]MCI2266836.1 SipW-dependent-type signal peptide-containing protein [Sediminivirga luteola]
MATAVQPPATTGAMTPKEARRRKRRALAAAGLILGIGGAITLATWNDEEFIGTQVDSAGFALDGEIEGSNEGADGTYTQNPASAPGQLQFDVAEDGLMPEESIAAPYWIRLTAPTIDEADLVLDSIEASGGNLDQLSYEIYAGGTCSASNPSGQPLGSGSDLSPASLTAGTSPTLQPGTTVNDPGTPVALCVVLTAGAASGEAGFQPGETTTITWGLSAAAVQNAGTGD